MYFWHNEHLSAPITPTEQTWDLLILLKGETLSYQISTRIQALNFQYKELIGQQFSGSIICIVWAIHGTKISSKEAIVLEKQCDKSWTSR